MSDQIILALDYPDMDKNRSILEATREHIGMVKIGPTCFFSQGKEALNLSKEFNIPLFLDLNLHDNSESIKKFLALLKEQLADIGGQHLISIDMLASSKIIEMAYDFCLDSNLDVAGLTILASLNKGDLYNLPLKTCMITSLSTRLINNMGQEVYRKETRSNNWSNTSYQYDVFDHLEFNKLKTFVVPASSLKSIRENVSYKDINLIISGVGKLNNGDDSGKPLSFIKKYIKPQDKIVFGSVITEDDKLSEAALFYSRSLKGLI